MVDFVNTYRDELFPGAAVVFAAGSPRPGPKATGVVFPLDLKSTIDVAIQLHPDLRQVFVVSGASDTDRFYQDLARAQFRAFDGRLGFTYSSGLAMPDLLRRVAELPRHTIVYFLSFFEDGHGSKFDELKALDQVAAAANVPTYAWIDTRVGHGSVGGSVLNVETRGWCPGERGAAGAQGRIARKHPRARDRRQHHPIRLAAAPALGHQRNPTAGREPHQVSRAVSVGSVQALHRRGDERRSCCRRP